MKEIKRIKNLFPVTQRLFGALGYLIISLCVEALRKLLQEFKGTSIQFLLYLPKMKKLPDCGGRNVFAY